MSIPDDHEPASGHRGSGGTFLNQIRLVSSIRQTIVSAFSLNVKVSALGSWSVWMTRVSRPLCRLCRSTSGCAHWGLDRDFVADCDDFRAGREELRLGRGGGFDALRAHALPPAFQLRRTTPTAGQGDEDGEKGHRPDTAGQ